MKISQLRALSASELTAKEKSIREELFKINQQRYSGRVEKPHMFSALRRDLARIETLMAGARPKSSKGQDK